MLEFTENMDSLQMAAVIQSFTHVTTVACLIVETTERLTVWL